MVFDAVLALAVLLISVILHENAHGWTALALGDDTASKAGRLTLNPVKHLDVVGSFILPAMMFFTTGAMFGYAKPVPVSPQKLKGTDRMGFATVALAGPVANVVIAFGAVVLLRQRGFPFFLEDTLYNQILVYFFEWNILLAAFNLVPIPPLDGSRLVRVFLGTGGRRMLDRIEPFGFLILLGLIVWLSEPFFRVINVIRDGLLRLLPM